MIRAAAPLLALLLAACDHAAPAAKAAPAAEEIAAPALPQDAVSVGLLVKAKKLVKNHFPLLYLVKSLIHV